MIVHRSLLLFLSSPLLLAAAYYTPDYLSFAIFLFLIPLFYLVLTHPTKKSSYWFWRGMLWGLIFYALHWITFIPFFFNYAYGWLRLMIYPFLILYASLWTGLWFFICSSITQTTKRVVLSWAGGTFLYFYLFEQYALVPFGSCAGYPFANPVILLAPHCGWCSTIPIISRSLLLILLIFFQMGCAYVYITRQAYLLPLVSLLMLPFVGGRESKHHDGYSKLICPVSASPQIDVSYLDAAQSIAATLLDARIEHPNAQVFILPESAFPFCLNVHPEIIELWTDTILHEDKTLIIGSQYLDGENKLFNTLYVIKECRITQTYNKKHLMPFIEYLPDPVKHNPLFTTLFFHKNRPFSLGEVDQDNLLDLDQTEYSTAICSEFFLYNHHYRKRDQPLIVIVNDNWFAPYFQYLMYLYACSHAHEYSIPIFYIGHKYSSIIDYCN